MAESGKSAAVTLVSLSTKKCEIETVGLLSFEGFREVETLVMLSKRTVTVVSMSERGNLLSLCNILPKKPSIKMEVITMRKCTQLIAILTILLLLAGCSSSNQSTNVGSETIPSSGVQKEILKIQSFAETMVDESNYCEPDVRQITINYDSLSEIENKQYEGDDQLRIFAEFIDEELGIQLNDKWTVLTHFYDDEKTVGMVKFQYWIGNISTNKCITFNVDHGKANMVLYTCLEVSVDEESLLTRIPLFEARYEQEKLELKDDQQLIDETVSYAYYYNTGNLMYTYNVFFKYGEEGVINNEYGTECYIDENGYAVETNA